MNDDTFASQDSATCEKCKENPCICSDKNISPKAPSQKPRVKGSHRNGKPPKLKWL